MIPQEAHITPRIAITRTKIQTSSGKLFIIEADEPPILIGSDKAPNAVQTVLHALASCLIVGFVYNAAVRGINIKAVNINLEGDLDLRGFLGISEDVRPGYQNIRVICRIKSDAPRDRIEEVWEYARRTSPVTDIIRNGVPVSITLEQ
ncbi:putative redox protein, regulator of disulfide bond formation [Candidatus Methanoperedens nitroreducens]|uniref:Putative redox protein, regulator of disulfide bond formation n=1 Tax=Candidatus Methanoperedens nitratireducens TaxID=1392998 RepID=A0A062V3L1_9EURY|nr:OsmC family protein [Candidatus Methanoperedens nitroreducens]KCZ73686.1 putative redox protein, regulator of disulfide bond formation [Candidatus Methanoperedens nitroreducens]MDJ1422355.1 OsmC family protein [Candidatus Methanoperedens sp.]